MGDLDIYIYTPANQWLSMVYNLLPVLHPHLQGTRLVVIPLGSMPHPLVTCTQKELSQEVSSSCLCYSSSSSRGMSSGTWQSVCRGLQKLLLGCLICYAGGKLVGETPKLHWGGGEG